MIKVTPFRLEHYRKLLVHLLSRGDIKFITYNDLLWQKNDNHNENYPMEWASWRKALDDGLLDSKTTYILLQHDIDSGPKQTLDMLHLECEYGICSNTMIFNKWRGVGANQVLMDYPVDFKSMAQLERHGFVFGYHCNAFHNNDLREEGLFDVFLHDLKSLREKLCIQFFSPHGGLTINGIGNASFDYISATGADVKHVQNGHSPRFNSTYSDGGLIKRLHENDSNVDFMTWCESLKPGGRYRMLIHPQYFSDELFQPLSTSTNNWYFKFVGS